MKNHLKYKFRKIVIFIINTFGFDKIIIKIKKGIAKNIYWTIFPYSMYWRGDFEKSDEAALIINSLKNIKKMVFWDLGAHFGFYSLVLAKKAKQKNLIYSFEPDPISYSKLKFHAKINHFNNITPFNLAVGEKNRTVFLDQNQGKGESTAKIIKKNNMREKIKVKMIKLDYLIKQKKILPPGLIKIDIEGYGHQAIIGSIKTIKRYKPLIIFSFHPQINKKELKKTKNLLNKLYTPFNTKGKKIKWEKIKGTVLLKSIN